MVRLRVSLIAATGGPVSAIAAKSATSTIPIVFTAVADPVRSGLVESLRRPGANITGTAGLTTELDPFAPMIGGSRSNIFCTPRLKR